MVDPNLAIIVAIQLFLYQSSCGDSATRRSGHSNCLSKLSVPEFAGGYASNLSAGPDRGCKPYPFYN
ncbi:hypothetical protein D3C75_746640 [compost metagenome]